MELMREPPIKPKKKRKLKSNPKVINLLNKREEEEAVVRMLKIMARSGQIDHYIVERGFISFLKRLLLVIALGVAFAFLSKYI